MSKRSSMEKMPRDLYETTDPKALPTKFLEFIRGKTYAEPNCGSGQLINLIGDTARCMWASDIEPLAQSTSTEGLLGEFTRWDAMCLSKHELSRCDLIIGNPPYTKSVLLPMIDHFISLKPTWLLLPASHMNNVYFAPYMERCSRIVSIGRLRWFKGSPHTSTDDFCWYFWQKGATEDTQTIFYGR